MPPVLVAGPLSAALWLTPDGEIETLEGAGLRARIGERPPLLCHRRAFMRRLDLPVFPCYDILELFAFVRPAAFAVPTPGGLARALGLPPPTSLEGQALTLLAAARALIAELATREEEQGRLDVQARDLAFAMAAGGWSWGPAVLAALGHRRGETPRPDRGLRVWDRLPEWEEGPAPAPPGSRAVEPQEARRRLAELLGQAAEDRPQQADYAAAVAMAFAPRERQGEPRLLLAEAGTGVGKTLGYIAPASLWAEMNGAPVWISTFTRNLQHQIDGELSRLFPDPRLKRRKVVLRKGRENYLCLLNFAERVRSQQAAGEASVALGLVARWAAASRDGDMVGGDFPGWLADLIGQGRGAGLTDRRGECIHSACEFYKRCFVERSVRRARRADLVVANHALILVQAALGASEEGRLPSHIVFDEGHHLFEAADSAFSASLSGLETRELRRWLAGAEGGGRSRLRGLRRRLEGLAIAEAKAQTLEAALTGIERQARVLPGDGWQERLANGRAEGAVESFLLALREQVLARAQSVAEGYSLECQPRPANLDLAKAAAVLEGALGRLEAPLAEAACVLESLLEEETESLTSDERRRLEALLQRLARRALTTVRAWRAMLQALPEATPPEFVDWLSIERRDGREIDLGYHRHWLDPTLPLARSLFAEAQGIVVTSATLTDASGLEEEDWQAAEVRSGAHHLPRPALRARVPSPFDYAAQTRVFLVKDLRRDSLGQLAAAMEALFLAAGGGALGLFTAISRLKAVRDRLAASLEAAGLALYAQHVDGLDVATLVEIFRSEPDSCLLGTDAVRDGVDVPGRALRLIVFDRVPWPRPDLLHKARRAAFGGKEYDERLTRLKLRQAFGRLVRRADDRGVFVMLDPMMPSRFLSAFPEGVAVRRVGIAEAVSETRDFLSAR